MQIFSPAQCFGYLTFLLGVAAFLQKKDRPLIVLMAIQSLTYAIHFLLLGNLPASGSSLISFVRTLLALKTSSPALATALVFANIAMGVGLAKTAAAWLPVAGACMGTVAVFLLRGIPMRLVFLLCSALWLANNILSGSIGGTMLEATVGLVNAVTIIRMVRRSAKMSKAGRGSSVRGLAMSDSAGD